MKPIITRALIECPHILEPEAMSRLTSRKLEGYSELPWGNTVTRKLRKLGYTFTKGLVATIGHVTVWEVMKGEVCWWTRAFNLGDAPTGYFEQMFPDGLKPEETIEGDHVASVLDIQQIDGWIFSFTEACVTNLEVQNKLKIAEPAPQGAGGSVIQGVDKERFVRDSLRQVSVALQRLHSQGYSHGDLCPENCLIDNRNQIQLTGYSLVPGYTGHLHLGHNFRFRPPTQCTPAAADSWAFGVMMYEMLTGKHLVEAANTAEHFGILGPLLTNGGLRTQLMNHPKLSSPAADFILACLHPDESMRPVIGFLDAHEFFEGFEGNLELSLASSIGSEVTVPENDSQVLSEHGVVVKSEIGHGFYGAVFRVKFDDKYLAMKQIQITSKTNMTEIEIVKSLNFRHLIKIALVVEVGRHAVYVLMELAVSDLKGQIDVLDPAGNLDAVDLIEERMRHWLYHVGLGMVYLHDHGYAHLDIHAKNCLIRGNDQAVLADFGQSQKLDDPDDFMFLDDVDMYEETIELCLFGEVFRMADEIRRTKVSADAKDLICDIRDQDIRMKPKIRQILEHSWFINERNIQEIPPPIPFPVSKPKSSPYQQYTTPSSPYDQYSKPASQASPYDQYARPTSAYDQYVPPTSPYDRYVQPPTPSSPYDRYAQPSTPSSPYDQYVRPSSSRPPQASPYDQYARPTSVYDQYSGVGGFSGGRDISPPRSQQFGSSDFQFPSGRRTPSPPQFQQGMSYQFPTPQTPHQPQQFGSQQFGSQQFGSQNFQFPSNPSQQFGAPQFQAPQQYQIPQQGFSQQQQFPPGHPYYRPPGSSYQPPRW